MKNIRQCSLILLCLLLLSACGPSEEAIATMTASAWTPTPEPTLTPTPIPIDLEVRLEDAEGNPVTYAASVSVAEADSDATSVDASGKTQFMNLPDTDVTIQASAQGYLQKEEAVSLERGANSIVVVMEPDPTQLMPASACQTGQEILMLEDFEDEQLQGWDNFSRPDFDFEEIEGKGTVLVAAQPENWPYVETPGDFADTVFHFEVLREAGDLEFNVEYLNGSEQGYQAGFRGSTVQMAYLGENGPDNLGQHRGIPAPDGETWTKITIAFYGDAYDLYADDTLVFGTTRSDTNKEGVLFLGIGGSGEAQAKFDNFVLCGLSEPYEPVVEE